MQVDKNIYDDLDVDLLNYKEISTDFLNENHLKIEVVDSNLNVIYSKGVNENSNNKYTPEEIASLFNFDSFEMNIIYKTFIDDDGNENTIILFQYLTGKVLNKLKQMTYGYVIVLIVGTILIFLALFILCVKNIYKNIKKDFLFIQNNIAKTPYDRTKINIIEAKLLETRDVAESYNEMLNEMERIKLEKDAITNKNTRLISNLSHDLKSPITTLKGYSEILLNDDVSAEERKEYAKFINNSASDLNEMISILFEQVKFQNSDYKLNLTVGDINTFLRDICANYYMIFDKRGFNIEIAIEEKPHIMNFDNVNLKRAFVNILENCLSHNTIPTDVCVSSKTSYDKYIICIMDNGKGISKNAKDMIFEAFYQEDSSRTSGQSGLGLYVVKQIIEKHGGHISLKTNNDYKTIFEITFKV